MIAQRVMRSLNIEKFWRKGHTINYEILCPKFAQSSVRLSETLLKLGVIQWFYIECLIDSFKINIRPFILVNFPLLFLVSFTNKVCLYCFQGRFNIRQPFFLCFLFLNQKLEFSLLQVVHTLIYNLLPNPVKKQGDFCTDLLEFVWVW